MVQKTPFSQALTDHQVSAVLSDLDHYRIHGGMAVETDFIIRVECKSSKGEGCDPSFECFTLSKTYSHFRTFAKQLKNIADGVMSSKGRKSKTDETTKKLAQYCETVHHLTESQRHQYVGKVNYKYVKVLAKKRSQIIQEMLEATLNYFPENTDANQFSIDVSHAIETFFLTDHCIEVDGPQSDAQKNYSSGSPQSTTDNDSRHKIKLPNIPGILLKKISKAGQTSSDSSMSSPVVPITRKNRSSIVIRQADVDDLEKVGKDASLLLDDERPQTELVPSYSAPVPTYNSSGSKIGKLFENNPIVFALMTVFLMVFLKRVATMAVTVDLDVLLLFIWAAFCIGLHSPRPMISGIDKNFGPPSSTSASTASDVNGRKLLRNMSHRMSMTNGAGMEALKNMDIDDDDEDIMKEIQSPLPIFPKGAALGSHLNCWSQPICNDFYVRGPNYLKDKVKIESADFLWPVRGVDLFLTDTPPENVGRFTGIMGGRLRDVPTFIINFRLPWGVLLTYFEIPEMYIPFIKAGHDSDFDRSTLSSMDSMTPGQRCVARYCQSSSEEKDTLLKIVPGVADGPWVVKSVVGNKPAIIGTKMPVSYVYEKEEEGKSMYLEMDLDIVASSAARGILSMVRTYTNVLTMDLGFVVQGNQEDELPEQMLAGTRLHGLDPLNSPALPVSQEHLLSNMKTAENDSDDEDES